MDTFTIDGLWDREPYDRIGRLLGRIDAGGMGLDRLPQRIGIRSGRERELRFFAPSRVQLEGERLVIDVTDTSLRVLSDDPN